MFIGHYGVALAAKRVAPSASLGTLVFAAQWLDLLWPILVLMGVERVVIKPGTRMAPLDFTHYPISHSLLVVLGWSVLIGGACFFARRDRRTALVIGALVASHWILDLLVHRPDLPLAPGSAARVGFGLWNHPWLELPLELGIFALGAWFYLRSSAPADRKGSYLIVAFLIVLTLIHVGNIFGPPPPSALAVGWVSLLLWLFVPFAGWADRHRTDSFQSAANSHRGDCGGDRVVGAER